MKYSSLSLFLGLSLVYFDISFAQSGTTSRNRRQECSSICNSTVTRENSGRANPAVMYQCISKCQSDASFYKEAKEVAQENQQQNSGFSSGGCTMMVNGNPVSASAEECNRAQSGSSLAIDKNSSKSGTISDGTDNDGVMGNDPKTAGIAKDVVSGCKEGRILNPDTGECEDQPQKMTETESESNNNQNSAAAACASDSQSVATYCNSENQSWMNSINNTVKTLGPMANQLNPSASTCGSIAAASTGAEASIATFKVMCKNAVESCLDSCAAVNDSSSVATCKQHKLKADEAQRSVASAMMTLQGSVATCKNAFGSLDNQAQAYCATNPASCQTNLGGLQTSNLQGDLANGSPGGSLDTPGTGGGNTGVGSTDASVGDLGDDGDGGIGTIAAAKQGEDIGGSKGGGGAASADSGSGGEAAGGGSGGKKESGLLTSILSGFFGTGGGSGSSGGGGGGWKSWFGGGKGGDAYAGNQPNKVKGPDLRQFLPGGLKDPMKNRGIAGQLVGQDGMTGPHSDIWKQINNRYQYKRASLLP